MRFIPSAIIAILLCCSAAWPAAAGEAAPAPPVALYIDGTKLAVEPILNDNSAYIPVRAAMEYMGAQVSYAGSTITVTRGTTTVAMQPNAPAFTINGISMLATASPMIIGGSTYLPIRMFGSAFGYDVEYQPAARAVVLHTPGEDAVVYGFAGDADGSPIRNGILHLQPSAAGAPVIDAPIHNGFYRVKAAPGAYAFAGFEDLASGEKLKTDAAPFTLAAGQTVFYPLAPSQAGFKVTLYKTDGMPVRKATATFNTSHGAVDVKIRNGIGYLDFHEPGSYTFNYLTIDDGSSELLDIYYPFKIEGDGTAGPLDLTAHTPNIVGQVSNEAPSGYGSMGIFDDSDSSEPGSNFVQPAPGGAFAFYLPDGRYEWSDYYDGGIREHFDVRQSFIVANGVPDRALAWSKPAINLQGTAATGEGEQLSGGYLYFRDAAAGKEYGAWVQDGRYACYVPDGTYDLVYEQFFDGRFQLRRSAPVTVAGGKLSVSPDLVFDIA
ncbi:copper amine oxidase N-terminal domain-containing protein [Paenibacillus lycopersici]|uniref:Copper amine oxidase N-terminal domain-containing protein n=1 Tax=Paenibacillus lycopersici TaxID=2704462 RepID=A0A6C0FV70_9BACL|nr:copper amine oxidase N-terminal domain-containing protein [Paenibacillus lycopersici]QHT58839.1 copper amine oxidase N-terminal domain-containing protein [Paenibacillus lycopersici]